MTMSCSTLSTHRASTWPVGPERFVLKGDRFVLAFVPASMVEGPPPYRANSLATVNSWLGVIDTSQQYHLTNIPVVAAPNPLEIKPCSIGVEASSRDPDHDIDPNISSWATPESSVWGGPRCGTPDILRNVGGIAGPSDLSSPRISLSDGTRTPVSQSGISLTSGYHYQTSSSSSAIPTMSMPVFVTWQRPNLSDFLACQGKFFQQPSSKTSNRSQTSTRIADVVDDGDSKHKIQHFTNPTVHKIRAQARQGMRDLSQNKPQAPERAVTKKRARSPSPLSEPNAKDSVHAKLCPDCKRRKQNEEDESNHSKDGSEQEDQESS